MLQIKCKNVNMGRVIIVFTVKNLNEKMTEKSFVYIYYSKSVIFILIYITKLNF